MYRIELIDKIEDFLKIKDEWNSLLKKTDTDVPYLTHEWLTAWWECFGGQSKLAVILVKDGKNLCAAAPLMLVKKRRFLFNVIYLMFIGNALSCRLNFLVHDKHEEYLNLIIDYIVNCIKWDIAKFYHIPQDSETYKALMNVLKKNPIFSGEEISLLSPYIFIDGNWESYFKNLSRSFISTIKKKKRKLERIGYSVLTCRDVKDFESVKIFLEDIFKIAEKTWQHEAGTSITSDAREKKFYTLIAEHFNQNNRLYLYILKIGNENAAFGYGIKYNGILYSLKKGYDQKYKNFSPGIILDAIKYEDFVSTDDSRHHEIDLGGHIDQEKMSWTKLVRRHNVIYLFRKRFFILYFWLFKLKPLLRRIGIPIKIKSFFSK